MLQKAVIQRQTCSSLPGGPHVVVHKASWATAAELIACMLPGQLVILAVVTETLLDSPQQLSPVLLTVCLLGLGL